MVYQNNIKGKKPIFTNNFVELSKDKNKVRNQKKKNPGKVKLLPGKGE